MSWFFKPMGGIGSVIGGYSSVAYVRPAGTTYGTGDGSSYDNAWAGNAAIVWEDVLSGGIVYAAGDWNEALIVGSSNVTIESVIADPFTVDGTSASLVSGVSITSKDNVTLNGLTVTNVTTSCFHFDGCLNVITTDCVASLSGNQGFQHLGVTTFRHNNPTISNCTDDGISVHDTGVGFMYGGTLDGNDQNINIVAGAHITINDSPTFTGISTVDLYVTNATTDDSSVITMNGGTVRNIDANIGGRIVLNDVIVTGTSSLSASTGNGSMLLNGSILQGGFTGGAGGSLVANDSRLEVITSIQCPVEFNRTRVLGDIVTASTVKARNSHLKRVDFQSGGTCDILYTVFTGMAASTFAVSLRTGVTKTNLDNCAFIGSANVGRGIFSQIDVTTNNNICIDLETGYQRTAGISVINNYCFFDCTTAKAGTITSNSEQTGDPLFTNAGVDDYSLLEGSSCIGTGADLGETYDGGIESADWGDSDTVPVVTSGLQAVSWNIGAYV